MIDQSNISGMIYGDKFTIVITIERDVINVFRLELFRRAGKAKITKQKKLKPIEIYRILGTTHLHLFLPRKLKEWGFGDREEEVEKIIKDLADIHKVPLGEF